MAALKRKLKEWLLRYGPAELLSLALTIAGGWTAGRLAAGPVAIALAATWCGNIGYFGTILWQDVHGTKRYLKAEGRPYTWRVFARNIRALLIEFGVAEALDTLLIRPFLLYQLPLLTGNLAMGLVAGKFLADITFYVPSILFYELSKKRFRKF